MFQHDPEIKINIYTPTSTRREEESKVSYTIRRSYFASYLGEDNIRNDNLINSLYPDSFLSSTTEFNLDSLINLQDQILNFISNSIYSSGELKRDDNIVLDIEKHHCRTNETNEECSICQSKTKLGDILSRLNCKHIFHNSCIIEWGKYKQECPLCRAQIKFRYENINSN